MTGAVRAEVGAGGHPRFYNSFFIFGRSGQLLDVYDKFHLVPFGEYLPLAPLLTRLDISKLVNSPGGFTAGSGPHTYAVPGAPPVGPLICYEVIFPDAVIGRPRPGWLVNVTDDFVVRPAGLVGAVSTSPDRTGACHRGGAADRPCGEYRRLRDYRSTGTNAFGTRFG